MHTPVSTQAPVYLRGGAGGDERSVAGTGRRAACTRRVRRAARCRLIDATTRIVPRRTPCPRPSHVFHALRLHRAAYSPSWLRYSCTSSTSVSSTRCTWLGLGLGSGLIKVRVGVGVGVTFRVRVRVRGFGFGFGLGSAPQARRPAALDWCSGARPRRRRRPASVIGSRVPPNPAPTPTLTLTLTLTLRHAVA